MTFGVLLFVLAILIIVMVHESGHFLVAKLFGFKAPQFFIGFGPTLWSFKRGETEYGIKAIPAGGFVKIIGMNPYEEVPPEDVPRAYPSKPRWQRALLLLAGSATHWVIAFVILFVTALTIGFPTDRPSNEVRAIEAKSPAAASGLEPGDVIVAIDSEPTDSWSDVKASIRAHPGDEVAITVERDGETQQVDATIGRALFDGDGGPVAVERPGDPLPAPKEGEVITGFLGVVPEAVYETFGPLDGLARAGSETWQFTEASVTGIDDVFAPVWNGDLWAALQGEGERDLDEGPVGVVGASRIAGETVQRGEYLQFIGLIVFFTIFVGILNLLPLPPLDGGHLAVVVYESITGQTVDIRKLIPVAAAVISFFVILFIAVLYLDIARPVKVPL